MRTGELDEPVAQILSLEKDKNHEYCQNAGGCQRPQQGRDQCRDAFQGRRRRLAHLDRDRLDFLSWACRLGQGRRRVLRLVKFLAEVLQNIGRAFKGPLVAVVPRSDLILSRMVSS